METQNRTKSIHTFFYFGMTVYMTSFLALIHFFRVRKVAFREDFGKNFVWPFKGIDFHAVYSVARDLFGKDSGGSTSHPPWVVISYLPFTLFDRNFAYILFTYILLAALFFCIFLCLRENQVFKSKQLTLLIALMLTGIYYHTYPVLFTVERGQLTMLLGLFAAIGLFAVSRNFWKTAVITLAIAVQYKVYPVILGSILFIRFGWKILMAYIFVNILILFIRGYEFGILYLKGLANFITVLQNWPGNHSLTSFAQEMVRLGYLPESLQNLFFKGLFIAVILIFLLAFFWITINRKPCIGSPFSIAEAGLIGMAFQLMSLLPTSGHDYRLPIHIIPFLLMISRNKKDFTIPRVVQYFLIAALSVSMAFIFVPFFLIKTFGIITSFIIYAVFAFSPELKEPEALLSIKEE